MNALDIILLCFAGLLIFNGIRKGFIISLAGLIALILGIYAAVHFSNYISRILSDNLHPSGSWLPILSFSLTFLIVVILVMLVAKVVEKVVTIAGMGFLNRLAGALFGLLKAVVVASVILFIMTSVDTKEKLITPKTKRESFFFSYVAKIFPEMLKLAGGEIKFMNTNLKF